MKVTKKVMVAPKVAAEQQPAVVPLSEPETELEEGSGLTQGDALSTPAAASTPSNLPPLPIGMAPPPVGGHRKYDPNRVLPASYRQFFYVLK